jgi:tetratricopeptide (TPR) repeat protein
LDLAADYSPNVIPVSLSWHAGNSVGLGLTLLVLVAALIAWRRPPMTPGAGTARTAAFGVVWFMIAISPISNALFLSGVLLAERTLYLPSVGLAAATGWLVVRMARDRPRGAWIGLAVILLLAGARTWTRTPTWRDNESMLTTLVSDYPQSGRSQWILGDAFIDAGAISEGLRSYRLAINILGPHYQLLTEISKKLIRIEHMGAAERLLVYASQNNPEFPLAFGLLATVRAEHGDAEGTVRNGRRALAMWEPDPVAHHLVAWALAAQGRWEEAAESRRRADELAAAPGFWQQWMYLAYTRRHAGDSIGAYTAVDSAWARVGSERARAALDSVRVTEFGLPPLLEVVSPVADTVSR